MIVEMLNMIQAYLSIKNDLGCLFQMGFRWDTILVIIMVD